MPLFKKYQRYKVSRKYDFIQNVTLLNGSTIECNLTVESTGADCLDNVLQRLEIREVELFGLRYISRETHQLVWVDPDKPLKKQLDKHAEEDTQISLAIMFYVERAYALRDEPTRYNYYLQVKSDVLDSKILCSLEKAIILASYSLQAEYGNYDMARKSADYLRDIENLDTNLIPASLVSLYDTNGLADIAQHIVSSHMSLTDMSSNQAEKSYLYLAQQIDGYGIEYVTAMTESGGDVYLGNSITSVTIRRNDGHILHEFTRSQITSMSMNKKCFYISTSNKKQSIKLLLNEVEQAKYILRLFDAQQGFHTSNQEDRFFTDEEFGLEDNDELLQTQLSRQLSNLGKIEELGAPMHTHELSVDEQSSGDNSYRLQEVEEFVNAPKLTRSTPDLLESSFPIRYTTSNNSDYATIKFNSQPEDHRNVPPQNSTRNNFNYHPALQGYDPAPTSMQAHNGNEAGPSHSGAIGPGQTPMLDQLRKNELFHRSLTALQEYRDVVNEHSNNRWSQSTHQLHPAAVTTQLATSEVPNSHIYSQPQNDFTRIPSYRPSPDYETVMRMREINAQAFTRPQQQEFPPIFNRTVFMKQAAMSASQPDISVDSEPLYANLNQYSGQVTKHKSEVQLYQPQLDNPQQFITNPAIPISSEARPHYTINPPDLTHQIGYRPPPLPPMNSDIGQPQPSAVQYAGGANYQITKHSPDLIQPTQAQYNQSQMYALREQMSQVQMTRQSVDQVIMQSGGSARSSRSSYRSATPSVHDEHDSRPRSPLHLSRSPVLTSQNLPQYHQSKSTHVAEPQYRTKSPIHIVSESSPALQLCESAPQTTRTTIPTPAISTTDERLKDLEDWVSTHQVAADYESVLTTRRPADTRVALRQQNAARNRFPNFLPYEETRVKLPETAENPDGYINASHIRLTAGPEKLNYIATQNPLPDTVSDFWSMIWLHHVNIISMLTELEERSVQKCPRYWPQLPGSRNAVATNDLKVVLQYSNSSPNFTTSCLKVLNTATKEHRTVWHVQYTDWHQNFGCPKDKDGFLMYMDELNSVRLHVIMSRPEAHICMLVHCSSGVGRSGVVILTDIMKKCLEHNQKIDVMNRLRELRDQRMYMVQNLHQYQFVYDTLIRYLRGVRLI